MMAAVADAFGVGRQALAAFVGPGRSYFITDLLREVIFPESALAGVERKFERERAWLQRGAYATAIGFTVIAALWWSTSFTRNRHYVSVVEDHIGSYEQAASEPADLLGGFDEVLPRLDALHALVGVAGHSGEGAPWSMRAGLYQGDKLRRAGAHGATLRQVLADPSVDADAALEELRWWPKVIGDEGLADEHIEGKRAREECLALGCHARAIETPWGAPCFFCGRHGALVPAALFAELARSHREGRLGRFTQAAYAAILAVQQREDPQGRKSSRAGGACG